MLLFFILFEYLARIRAFVLAGFPTTTILQFKFAKLSKK